MKRFLKRLVCKLIGHEVNENQGWRNDWDYDGVSFCERCGEYDV